MRSGDVKEIGLNGLTSALSDYDCNDGDLQVCHNLVNDGEGLKPIGGVDVEFTLPEQDDPGPVVYVHQTATGKNYLYTDRSGNLCWVSGNYGDYVGQELENDFGDGENTYEISSIGNVLVISLHAGTNHDGLYYYRWKIDSHGGVYVFLGNNPPDLNLYFYLKRPIAEDSETQGETKQLVRYNMDLKFESEYALSDETVKNAFMGSYNKMVEEVKSDNMFLRPFLVRYAYKLYDGSYINVSSPVLMQPSDWFNPFGVSNYGENANSISYKVFGHPSECFVTIDDDDKETSSKLCKELKYWDEIIQEICIFITPQIVNYSETGSELQVVKYNSDNYIRGKCIEIDGPSKFGAYYTGTSGTIKFTERYYLLPFKREGTMKDWIEGTYNFYLVKKLNLQSFLDNPSLLWRTRITDANETLSNLETKETLIEANRSRAQYIPNLIHAYNGRLNIANVRVTERGAFPIGNFSSYSSYSAYGKIPNSNSKVTVYIEENGQCVVTQAVFSPLDDNTYDYWGALTALPGFFYYPNPHAKYVHIASGGDNMTWIEGSTTKSGVVDIWIPLLCHPYLDGAYYYHPYYEDYRSLSTPFMNSKPTEIESWRICDYLSQPNYLYVSEVDNPFLFPTKKR